MLSIEKRISEAQALWSKGLEAEAAGEFLTAYQVYTEAHDLIMDCARLHQQAHQNLRRVNLKLGHYGELVTDCLLHLFAPLGVFELVSWFSKTDAFGSIFCKRTS
jgi:hypothetical protein